jgi:hypothetical protein
MRQRTAMAGLPLTTIALIKNNKNVTKLSEAILVQWPRAHARVQEPLALHKIAPSKKAMS